MEIIMERTHLENLEVYQLSENLADYIWDMVGDWDNFVKFTIGDQITRSADSIGANIAEGVGRGAYRDNRRFVKIARGSLYETKHWLRRAFNRDLISQKQIDHIKPLIDELSPRLNAYLRSINKPS